jgi:tetratricopeptide (TPR) repeat protein
VRPVPFPRRRPWLWLGLILLIAWWAGVWLQLADSVLLRVPILDEAFYLREGHRIAEGQLLPGRPFVMSPFYPFVVAGTASGRDLEPDGVCTGPGPWGLRVLQAVAWLGIALLLWDGGRRSLPRGLGLLPPLFWLLYQPAAIYATTALLEIPLTFLVTAFLWLIARPGRPALTPGRAFAAGLLVGSAALLRGHVILLLGVGWLVAALRRTRPGRYAAADPADEVDGPGGGSPDSSPTPGGSAAGGLAARWLRNGLLMTAAVVAIAAPPVIYNSLKGHRLVGMSANAGLNLYIGNGSSADGFYVTFAGFDFAADPAGVEFLSARLGRPVQGVAEADRIWASEAWRAIRARPWRAAALWAKKVWLHLVGWEIAQITPLAAWPRQGPLLRLQVVPYGVLAALALLGGWLARRERWVWPWLMTAGVLIASQSAFFVVSRYRQVLVPIFCLLGALGVARLLARPWKGRVAAGGLLVVALLVTRPWGLASVQARWAGLGLCNEGVRWERLAAFLASPSVGAPGGGAAALASADSLYRQALAIAPALTVANRNLARTLVKRGEPRQAEQVLAEGVLRVPRPALLEKDLINLLLEQGRVREALPRMAVYLRDHPADPDVLHNYAVALEQTGRLPMAIEQARRLVEAFPDDPRGYLDLGILLARTGRREQARAVFQAGLDRHPGNEQLAHNLDVLDAAGSESAEPK